MSTIECDFCHLQYNENDVTPRILTSCGHTICQQCVTKLSTDGRMITCPFDKRQVTVFTNRFGSDGVTDLSGKEAQKQERKSETKTHVPCFENPSHEAVVYCQQCEADFCDKCFTFVHKSKVLSAHQKIKVSEKPIKLPKCPKHPQNIAEFFCTDAECTNPTKTMCQTCVLFDQHKSHKYDCLMEKLLENEQHLKEAVVAQKTFQKTGELLTKLSDQMLASYDVAGEEFKNAVKVISDQFDLMKKEAICELTQFVNEKKEEKLELKRDVEKMCRDFEEFHKLIETLKITKDLQVDDKLDNWMKIFEQTIDSITDSQTEQHCLKDYEFIIPDMKLQIIEKPDVSLEPIVDKFFTDMELKYPGFDDE